MTLKVPQYLTRQEVLDSSQSVDLKDLNEKAMNSIIFDSEVLINWYLWYSFDITDLPWDIKLATLYTSERLIKQGWDITNIIESMMVSSEQTGQHRVSLNDKLTSQIAENWGLPPYVVNILAKYTSKSYISKQLL
jgi:hypothetical protein